MARREPLNTDVATLYDSYQEALQKAVELNHIAKELNPVVKEAGLKFLDWNYVPMQLNRNVPGSNQYVVGIFREDGAFVKYLDV